MQRLIGLLQAGHGQAAQPASSAAHHGHAARHKAAAHGFGRVLKGFGDDLGADARRIALGDGKWFLHKVRQFGAGRF